MPKKVKVKLNAYRQISEAVDRGISWGIAHAHKHVENPDEELLKHHLENDIMNELCEVIDFDKSG